jgi:hypothetical protein
MREHYTRGHCDCVLARKSYLVGVFANAAGGSAYVPREIWCFWTVLDDCTIARIENELHWWRDAIGVVLWWLLKLLPAAFAWDGKELLATAKVRACRNSMRPPLAFA